MTTHSMEEAEKLSTRLAIMTKGGEMVCKGTTMQIKNDYGTIFHIDLTLKSDQTVPEEEIDETCVDFSIKKYKNPMRMEIFQRL